MTAADNEDDRQQILQVIAEWVFYRDSGVWDGLRRCFARSGRMTTNSFSGTADEFVTYGRRLRDAGRLSHHFPGPTIVRTRDGRALAETLATLNARGVVHDVEVDVTVLLRYLDRFVHEDDAWRIEDRYPVYIKDRLDPVVPGRPIPVDEEVLAECPPGCRYLIYVSRANGAPPSEVKPTTYGTPEADRVYAAAEAWLAG